MNMNMNMNMDDLSDGGGGQHEMIVVDPDHRHVVRILQYN